jgi:hypothetical protein
MSPYTSVTVMPQSLLGTGNVGAMLHGRLTWRGQWGVQVKRTSRTLDTYLCLRRKVQAMKVSLEVSSGQEE